MFTVIGVAIAVLRVARSGSLDLDVLSLSHRRD